MKLAASVQAWWSRCSLRERRVVLVGLSLLVLALLYALLWDPALQARRRLAASLPTLRADVEAMRSQQRAIEAHRRDRGDAAAADLASALRRGAPRAGLLGPSDTLEPVSGNRVLVKLASADFDRWLAWLAELQRQGIRLERCDIVALPEPGAVRIEATLVTAAPMARRP